MRFDEQTLDFTVMLMPRKRALQTSNAHHCPSTTVFTTLSLYMAPRMLNTWECHAPTLVGRPIEFSQFPGPAQDYGSEARFCTGRSVVGPRILGRNMDLPAYFILVYGHEDVIPCFLTTFLIVFRFFSLRYHISATLGQRIATREAPNTLLTQIRSTYGPVRWVSL